MAPDTPVCIVSVDQFFSPGPGPRDRCSSQRVPSFCGGDPGEPGLCGIRRIASRSSAPEEGWIGRPILDAGPSPGKRDQRTFLIRQWTVFSILHRGFIEPASDPVTGIGGLRKPSLRIPPWGNGVLPGFDVNSEANLAADPAALGAFDRERHIPGVTFEEKEAVREIGWLWQSVVLDMQVGSDAVQACASCHFHAGGRQPDQEPAQSNHWVAISPSRSATNEEVVASDFSIPQAVDTDIPGEPLLNPDNVASDANDVMSLMGPSSFWQVI